MHLKLQEIFALTKSEKKHIEPDFGDHFLDLAEVLGNDLEAVTFALYPEVEMAVKALSVFSPGRTAMSGSGSSVFALFNERELMKTARENIAAEHPDWRMFEVKMIV